MKKIFLKCSLLFWFAKLGNFFINRISKQRFINSFVVDMKLTEGKTFKYDINRILPSPVSSNFDSCHLYNI